jgi:hypothetical protein
MALECHCQLESAVSVDLAVEFVLSVFGTIIVYVGGFIGALILVLYLFVNVVGFFSKRN